MLTFNLQKKFDSFSLNASLSVGNEIMVLLAPSGGGKSLTLNLISGIVKPDSGRIELNGTILYDSTKNIALPIRKRGIGYIFQNYTLFPNKSVRDNITFGMHKGEDRDRRLPEILEKFDLTEKENALPHQLSGGQKQRVAIARALAAQSRVMLFDEPLSSVDVPLRESLIKFIGTIPQHYNLPVLYVTHNFVTAENVADKIAVMRDGKIIESGTKDDILRKPRDHFTAQFLGIKNLFSCTVEQQNGAVWKAKIFDRFTFVIDGSKEVKQSKNVWLGIHPSDVRLLITGEDRPNMLNVYVENMHLVSRTYRVTLQVIENERAVEDFKLLMDIDELTCKKYRLSLHTNAKVSLKPDRLFFCSESSMNG